ncbi:MAG: outer membrane protein [Sphingomicrobium sp.]|nr:porin family protein [Sphingomonadales bacterium]
MFKLASLALPALLLLPQAAQSQTTPFNPYRGFRVEVNAGGDRFQAQGTHRNRFGYGASAGFDGLVTDHFLFGVEASYWRTRHGNEICTTDASGSTLCDRSGRELGAAFRAGFLVTPSLLIFGKAGFVKNRQSGSFVSPNGLFYINGRIVGPGYSISDRRNIDGYQLGGGIEYSLMRHVYVDAQYVRSRYDDRTSRQRVMAGVGVRF